MKNYFSKKNVGQVRKLFIGIVIFAMQQSAAANRLTVYSQTSIIRGSWAYQILAEKSAYNRGQRIIEVSYISLEQV